MTDPGFHPPPLPLLERGQELNRLLAALDARRPVLVTGPPGSGKSALLREALRLTSAPSVRVTWMDTPHGWLAALAAALGVPGGPRLPSASLKARILAELAASPCCVAVEDVREAGPGAYRFFQRIHFLPGCSLAVTSLSRASLGHLRKLLWDPRAGIALKPLPRAAAARLFAAAAARYGLPAPDLPEFRAKVLAAARGNPGEILAMCRLAAQPAYRRRGHLLFLPLRMDALLEICHD
jgi:hypothetical protein